jgi:hypothetical protein
MLKRFVFSEAAATYLTGTCGIDSLDEITSLDGIEDADTTIIMSFIKARAINHVINKVMGQYQYLGSVL